jgi:hypothetical protein
VAQRVLAETAIRPLVPYLDTLRWVFNAFVFGGISSPSTRGSTTGAGRGGDRRAPRAARRVCMGADGAPRRPHRPRDPLYLPALRRSGERAGRLAERLESMEKTHDAQRRMLEAAVRRPRSRGDLAERLRDGQF